MENWSWLWIAGYSYGQITMYAGDCDRLLEIAMGGWKMVRWLEIARDGFGQLWMA